MKTNPFDDENAQFHVVVNDEARYALWPGFDPVPAGWRSVAGPQARQDCLDHVESVWLDLRPASLRAGLYRPVSNGVGP